MFGCKRKNDAPRPQPQPPQPLAKEVVEQVNTAYYSSLIDAPDRARARALNGFTVASAIAAALAAAGLAKGLGGRPFELKAVGVAALALWLLAGGAYLCAVAGSTRRASEVSAASDGEAAARHVVDDAREQTKTVRSWLKRALALSVTGVLTTVVLVGLVVFRDPEDRKDAAVLLSAAGAREVSRLCDRGVGASATTDPLAARLNPSQLERKVVELRFDRGDCRYERVVLRLRSDLIRAVRVPVD